MTERDENPLRQPAGASNEAGPPTGRTQADLARQRDLVADGVLHESEAAAFLKISEALLTEMIEEKEIPFVIIHGQRRIPRRALQEYAAKNLVNCDAGCTRDPAPTATPGTGTASPASDAPAPATLFILNDLQKGILKVLKGRALIADALEYELNVDRKQLYRDGLKELMRLGKVKNNRRLPGYYRPDAPPPGAVEWLNVETKAPTAKKLASR